MKKLLSLILLALSACSAAWSQGYQYDPGDLNGLPRIFVPESTKGLGDTALNKSKDLTAFCPLPYNQGRNYTCVATAINGAFAIEKAIAENLKSDPREITRKFALSPVYPHKKMTGSCAQPVSFTKMWHFLQNNGNVSFAQTGYKNDCNGNFRAVSAADLIKVSPDSVVVFGDQPEDKLKSILYALSRNRPVVVGIQLRTNFHSVKRDYIIDDKYPLIDNIGHAVVAVGFDPVKEQVKFLNSHGIDFGEKGFFYMSYNDVKTQTLNAFTVRQPRPERSSLSRSVNLEILHYQKNLTGSDSPNVRYEGSNLYSFRDRVWTINKDMFQIIVPKEAVGWYIGVVNKTPDDSVKIVYPKMATVPSGVKGLEDDEVEDNFGIERFIPTAETAMDVREPAGTDYLCILMSPKPLKKTLRTLVKTLQDNPNSQFSATVQKAMGQEMIRNGIYFLPDKPGFEIKENASGSIAVMFLEIKSAK